MLRVLTLGPPAPPPGAALASPAASRAETPSRLASLVSSVEHMASGICPSCAVHSHALADAK
eukprot:4539008-Alexandrium_andersonii.AAC.1